MYTHKILSLLLVFIATSAGSQTQMSKVTSLSAANRNFLQREEKPSADFNFMMPQKLKGAGFGFAVLSAPFTLGPGGLRLGGDFQFTSLDRKRLKNVPLNEAAENGRVKLSEYFVALNFVARYAMPWDESVSPYIDGFVGVRQINTGITTRKNEFYSKKSDREIFDESNSLHYGLAGGLLITLASEIKLNIGVVYSQSYMPGSILNIRSATVEAGTIMMDKKMLPVNNLLFKVGLTVLLEETKGGSTPCQCPSTRSNQVIGVGSTIFSPPANPKIGVRVIK
jgi:opacity protein-like surface antigen